MLKGAELILVPNACPMELNRLSQLRARAFENMMAIATCNYPSCVPDCNGGSSLFDGVAYLPGQEASRDCCIHAQLVLELIWEYRKREVHGNAYRRALKYGLLLDTQIREPFLRKDRRE